jgi:hypothetical protein
MVPEFVGRLVERFAGAPQLLCPFGVVPARAPSFRSCSSASRTRASASLSRCGSRTSAKVEDVRVQLLLHRWRQAHDAPLVYRLL